MPRPKLHSDEDVLRTAHSVILRKGPEAFTLTDVANEVGISRAALIQRFKDKASLHLAVMEMATDEVKQYFDVLPPETGLDALWKMLCELIESMGGGETGASYLLLLWGDIQTDVLRRLSADRNSLVRQAIAERLPEQPHPRDETASLIQAVIQGACMQWLVEREGRLADFMLGQVRRAMQVLYPAHDFRVKA